MPREHIPRALLPPDALAKRWAEIAERRDDEPKKYVEYWTATWRRVLKICRAMESWEDSDAELLGELIEWRRLADYHQHEAEDAPYRTHAESGRVFAHPGFDKARDARREARECMTELGLTPRARAEAGLMDDPEDDDGPTGDQAGL